MLKDTMIEDSNLELENFKKKTNWRVG